MKIGFAGSICLAVSIASALAQPNPDRPDLCQGAYFTEAQGSEALRTFAKTYHDRASWETRAALIRTGIREGMNLPEKPQFAPLQPIRHSLRTMNGYTIENVAFESVPGFFVTGNLYRPTKSALANRPLCFARMVMTRIWKGVFGSRPNSGALRWPAWESVVFVYDMLGYGDSKQCSHHRAGSPEAPDPERFAGTGFSEQPARCRYDPHWHLGPSRVGGHKRSC